MMSINSKSVQALLYLRGEIPDDYRVVAWKALLSLPANSGSFKELIRRGPHPLAVATVVRYPLRDRKVARKLTVLVSALAHWSAVFGVAEFVPSWVFPFVVVFGQDDLGAFEAALSFLLHWGSRLLVNFPQPPMPILAIMESSLQHHDPRISNHLRGLGVGALSFGWPMLRSAFTEVLSRSDWLRLCDHLFANANDPTLLEAAGVAFVVVLRGPLLTISSHKEMEFFFRTQQAVDIAEMLRVTHLITREMREEGGRGRDAKDMLFGLSPVRRYNPLPQGSYPPFNGFRDFILDYQAQQREKIATEEREMRRKRLVVDLEQRAEDIGQDRFPSLEMVPGADRNIY
ncbi:unnamed protein product [Choristocarpus tenellus]